MQEEIIFSSSKSFHTAHTGISTTTTKIYGQRVQKANEQDKDKIKCKRVKKKLVIGNLACVEWYTVMLGLVLGLMVSTSPKILHRFFVVKYILSSIQLLFFLLFYFLHAGIYISLWTLAIANPEDTTLFSSVQRCWPWRRVRYYIDPPTIFIYFF